MKRCFSASARCIVIVSLFVSSSCGGASQKDSDSSEEKKDFYPMAQYIKSQLNNLDTVPLAIIKYKTLNNITDTTIITKPEFRKVAGALIQADVSVADKKDLFKETSFLDASLGTISLTYSPVKNNSSITQLNVLLKQTNSSVQSIYAEVSEGDVRKKLLWNANRSFMVTTISPKDGKEEVLQEKYVWNDMPYPDADVEIE